MNQVSQRIKYYKWKHMTWQEYPWRGSFVRLACHCISKLVIDHNYWLRTWQSISHLNLSFQNYLHQAPRYLGLKVINTAVLTSQSFIACHILHSSTPNPPNSYCPSMYHWPLITWPSTLFRLLRSFPKMQTLFPKLDQKSPQTYLKSILALLGHTCFGQCSAKTIWSII